MKKELKEGADYTYTPEGYMVFTGQYLLERGYCCGSGCRNCPYGYAAVEDPAKRRNLQDLQADRLNNNNLTQ